MKKIIYFLLSFTLLLLAMSGCTQSLDDCPEVDGQKATSFTAANNFHGPGPICGGYSFRDKDSCPEVDGWSLFSESTFTSSYDDEGNRITNAEGNPITVTFVSCGYRQ